MTDPRTASFPGHRLALGGFAAVALYWAALAAGAAPSTGQVVAFCALLVGAAGVVAARAALVPRLRSTWAVLAVGLTLWSGGFIWQAVDVLAGAPREAVSARDLLWFALYPCVVAAFAGGVRLNLVVRRREVTLDTLSLTAILAAVVLAVIVPPIDDNAAGLTPLEYAAVIGYAIGDAVLLAGAIAGVSLFGLRAGGAWVLIAVGTGALLAGDTVWATLIAADTWQFGSGGLALYPVFAWCIAAAAVVSTRAPAADRPAARDRRMALSSTLGAAAGFALLVANEWLVVAGPAVVAAAIGLLLSSHRPAASVLAQLRLAREAAEREALLDEVRRGLEAGELDVHFQPIVATGDEGVAGAEALLRWERDGAVVMPDAFLPVVERNPLMHRVTDHVLDRALAALVAWRAAGHVLGVSVNLAAIDVVDADLPRRVGAALRRHAVPPALLTLEMTETAAVEDMDTARLVLDEVDALGVMLSVDDFGVGHSSIARLAVFPIDEVKIDRSFVLDLESSRRPIVATTIALAHALKLEVVAEGVETRETCRALAGFGCQRAQGYLFARPLEPAAFAAWLDGR